MFGLGLARRMPRPLRGLAEQAGNALREGLPRPIPFDRARVFRRFTGRSVIVAGLFGTRSGLGRAASLLTMNFEARGVAVVPVDLSAALHIPGRDEVPAALTPADAAVIDASDLIVMANPPMFLEALATFDRSWLQNRCVIGHFVWELASAPRFWRRSARACDEIWVPSRFVAEALRRSLGGFDRPIRVVPHPVERDPFRPPTPNERARAREALGVSPPAFCAGYSFAMASNYARKNPEGAIAAFQRAFPDDPDVLLLLRCLDLDAYEPGKRRLAAAAAADGRIRLVGGTHPAVPIRDFYHAIDVYLAPLRAEGYGLNLVEAAQAGVPVIATDYSLDGPVTSRPEVTTISYDLVPVRDPQRFYRTGRSARWAEPNLDDMAMALRALR